MPSRVDPFACVPAIDRRLDELTRDRPEPEPLREAVRYALLGGGKRVRPALAWHACVAVGGAGECSLTAGAAVELVHAFSLVHDDLPALDNDDLRRGRPTLHVHAGEAMAILAGDAMLSMAFRVLVEPEAGSATDDGARAAALVRELSEATAAMIAGQVEDTLGEPAGVGPSSRTRLDAIHRNKTGALIRAACRMGAMSAPAEGSAQREARLHAITRYAEAAGLMFQVVDDLLDVERTSEQAGKRTRKDADAGKLTYPGVIGVEGSRREVARLRGDAMEALSGMGREADGLRETCTALAGRDR
ncbi:MAG: polyprenyl synthetase family protein [Phycisphaerales bacterium]